MSPLQWISAAQGPSKAPLPLSPPERLQWREAMSQINRCVCVCAHAPTFYASRGKLKGLNAHGSTMSHVAMQASAHVLRAQNKRAT
eukprot:7360827-Alexandrium_andersonii.AAC.1